MRTYRLTIKSQDLSTVNLVDSAGEWMGFSAIKAQRGNASPLLIPAGNEAYIIEQFGPPSADNPDVQEIIDFNRYYPIYVSAPAGGDTSESVNKLGALFIADQGIYNSYVTPSEDSAESISGRANFDIEGTDTDISSKAFNNDPATAYTYPSIFMQMKYTSTPLSPIIFEVGSTVEAILTDGTDTAKIAVEAIAWEQTTADDNQVYLPSGIVATDPDIDAFLLETPANAVVGAGWIDSSGTDPVVNIRIYMAFADESSPTDTIQTSTFGSAAEDLLHISNAFFAKFQEDNTSSYVTSTFESALPSAIAVIYQKFPTATETGIELSLISKHVAESTNVFNIQVNDKPAKSITIAPRDYTVSLDEDQVDGYNTSQYIEDVITEDRVVKVKYLSGDVTSLPDVDSIQLLSTESGSFTLTGHRVIDDYSYNGTIDVELTSALEAGWEEGKATRFDSIPIFFEPRGLVELNSKMLDIRATHQFARVVQPAGRGETTVSDLIAARTDYSNDHGLVYPVNEILTREQRTKTAWWRFPVGAYCVNLVNIMRQKNGAWAAMFQNEGGLGGQIDATYEDIRIKTISSDDQQTLDETGFNAMVFDPDFGLIMVNQRTGQNPNVISDSSWLGHDMSFDLFKKRVHKEVQFPQLGKPINAQ